MTFKGPEPEEPVKMFQVPKKDGGWTLGEPGKTLVKKKRKVWTGKGLENILSPSQSSQRTALASIGSICQGLFKTTLEVLM